MALRPNIVLLVCDDAGYNDFGFLNSSTPVKTPRIDALVQGEGGMRLEQFYVMPLCSPTRSALLTGRYTYRLGYQSTVQPTSVPWALDRQERLVSQELLGMGYDTMHIGKWHLGFFTNGSLPGERGYRQTSGYYHGAGDHYSHQFQGGYDWHTNGAVDFEAEGTYRDERIGDLAVDFISSHRRTRQGASEQPFFMSVNFMSPHSPFMVDDEWSDLYQGSELTLNERLVYGMISHLDYQVGRIVDSLESSDLLSNTLIFFTSDNGAPSMPSLIRNLPLYGFKGSIFEGGVRVPSFVYAPGLLPPERRVYRHMMHVTDVFPTFVGLAGGPGAGQKRELDGYDMWEAWLSGEPSKREEMLYNLNRACTSQSVASSGIRTAQYKLLVDCFDYGTLSPLGDIQLFDLVADPYETTNLHEERPNVVDMLVDRLRYYATQEDQVLPMTRSPPYQGEDYYCAQCPEGEPVGDPRRWAPWMGL